MKEAAAHPILQGRRILLRAPIETDKRDRLACGRNPEFRKMVGGDPTTLPPLTSDEIETWYAQAAGDPFHWIVESGGHCIGTARQHGVDRDNRRARYVIGIFDSLFWGKGYGTEITRLVLRYAFEQLNLHRIDLRVLAFNIRAIVCYEKCGFVREGIEREGSWIGGEWQSDIWMSILEHEYRQASQPTALKMPHAT